MKQSLFMGMMVLDPPDDEPSWVVRIALPALAVVFAAFCLWLTVRVINRRERWEKRTLMAILTAVLIGYPLSWGPACWMIRCRWLRYEDVRVVYRPVSRSIRSLGKKPTEHPIGRAALWWGSVVGGDQARLLPFALVMDLRISTRPRFDPDFRSIGPMVIPK